MNCHDCAAEVFLSIETFCARCGDLIGFQPLVSNHNRKHCDYCREMVPSVYNRRYYEKQKRLSGLTGRAARKFRISRYH